MKTLIFKILGIIYFIGAFLFVLLFFQTIGSIFSSVVNLQFGQALLRFLELFLELFVYGLVVFFCGMTGLICVTYRKGKKK